MEVKGKVKVIFDEQVISDKFKKREFVVIDESSKYPQELLIQTTNDKTSLLNELKQGQFVNVAINLRGRMWTNKEGVDKYFNSIEAWKIDFIKEDDLNEAEKQGSVETVPSGSRMNDFGDEGELPF